MDTLKIFRGLVIAEIVLMAVALATIFLPDSTVPEAVTEYLNGPAGGPLFVTLESGPLTLQLAIGALLLAYFAAIVASLFGLLRFRRWARATYVATVLLGFALLPAMGVTLSGPFEGAIDTLGSMVTGAVLAALLYEPVRMKFNEPPAPAAPRPAALDQTPGNSL